MKVHKTHGFAPKVRSAVGNAIKSLRLVNMLERAPDTHWTKDGKLKISNRHRTFKRANRFNANYGVNRP